MRVDTAILDAATLLALAMGNGAEPADIESAPPLPATTGTAADHTGMWLSADGDVRLTLKSDGTYERSITGRHRAAHGTYRVDGAMVLLRDDSGLRTAVTVADGALEMAGHSLTRG
jgi:Agrobacterium tumefaciens protein Atu4866